MNPSRITTLEIPPVISRATCGDPYRGWTLPNADGRYRSIPATYGILDDPASQELIPPMPPSAIRRADAPARSPTPIRLWTVAMARPTPLRIPISCWGRATRSAMVPST
jgi:hypothetical protein